MIKKIKLTWLSLAIMTITSVDSIRNVPALSVFGRYFWAWFGGGALVFLLPCIIASVWCVRHHDKGGFYDWIRQGLGHRMALCAIWFQWVENVVYYPALLLFIIHTLFFLHPMSPLVCNVMLPITLFFVVTWLNQKGLKQSVWFGNVCGFFGLILPMGLIIALGFGWYHHGHPLAFMQTSFVLSKDTLPMLTAIIVCFCGAELTTIYVPMVKKASYHYTIGLWLAYVMIILTMGLAAWSVSSVIPFEAINVFAGIAQVIERYFHMHHWDTMTPVMIGLSAIGSLGTLNHWTLGPCRSLQTALHDVTPQHAPKITTLLWLQWGIASLLLAASQYESMNNLYWYFTEMTTQCYAIAYGIFFSAVYRLAKGHRWIQGWMMVGGITLVGVFIIGMIPVGHRSLGLTIGTMILLISSIVIPIGWLKRYAHYFT
jgi:glutamate:GABA antiporter